MRWCHKFKGFFSISLWFIKPENNKSHAGFKYLKINAIYNLEERGLKHIYLFNSNETDKRGEEKMTKALVVEDDPLNMELVVEIVKAMGFKVSTAWNGKEAVEMAEKQVYDLIIMDIQLPDMDGIKTAEIIKSRQVHRDVPVIALTAFAMRGDREKFIGAGFSDYVPKPVDVAAFMTVLEKYRN